MVSSPAPHRGNLATSNPVEAGRQRSVLAALIASVAPQGSDALADALLAEFRTLGRIWTQTPEGLARILGAASPITDLILNARTAAIEAMAGDLRGIVIDPFSATLRQYLSACMGFLPDEVLRVLFLDRSRCLIADEQLQNGSLAQLALSPRTIFRRALEHNAAGLILVHNHPSGDPTPSKEDIVATRQLDQIGRALDVQIIDHIVVAASQTHHIMNREVIAGTRPEATTYTLRSPDSDPRWGDGDAAVANARATARRMLLRRQLIGAEELFGDPAWEMLIDLFIHEAEGKPLSISSLCVTSSIPMSSALRLVQKLCDAGILLRMPDLMDGRRSFIRLAPAVSHRIRAYFEAGPE